MWPWRPWVRVPLLTPFSPVCCCTAAQLPAMGCSQVVRHGTLTPAVAGSSPATPARLIFQLEYRDDPVAQSAEHLPFKQGVRGSNPRWVTTTEKPENPCKSTVFWFFFFCFCAVSPVLRVPKTAYNCVLRRLKRCQKGVKIARYKEREKSQPMGAGFSYSSLVTCGPSLRVVGSVFLDLILARLVDLFHHFLSGKPPPSGETVELFRVYANRVIAPEKGFFVFRIREIVSFHIDTPFRPGGLFVCSHSITGSSYFSSWNPDCSIMFSQS